MYLTPIAVVLSLALMPAFAVADPTASAMAPAATRQARALAETLARVSDEREKAAKALEPLEGLLSGQVAIRLSTTDPGVIAKVKRIVHDGLSSVVQKSVDAMADGYAANFSTEELGHVIAFVESPVGQAEKANLPVLKKELAAALNDSGTGDAAAHAFAAASPEKRTLVRQILTAQDFETHTRQGYARLLAIGAAAASQSGVGASAQRPDSDADPKAADDYVRLMTEVEEGFFVTHYSDAQLAAMVSYVESKPGQAILTRLPNVKRAVGAVLTHELSATVSTLPEHVCAIVACSPEQRTRLTEFASVMAAGILKLPALTDAPG